MKPDENNIRSNEKKLTICISATIEMGDAKETYEIDTTGSTEEVVRSPESKFEDKLTEGNNTLTLGDLAYARSGDKGTDGPAVGRAHAIFHVFFLLP